MIRSLHALAPTFALALLLPACSAPKPDAPAADAAPAHEVIKVGYLPITTALPFFVAKEQGLLAKRGLDVELERFETSQVMNTALMTGGVDVITSTAYSTILAIESRDPDKVDIFMVDEETPTAYLSSLVTLPATNIKSVADLRGRKVGIFPGPTAGVFFGELFKKHGLDPKNDLQLVELAAGSQMQALTSGQVEALATYEPVSTAAVLEHGAVKLVPGAIESEVMNPWQAGVWVVPTALVKDRPEVANRWMDAIGEAVDRIAADPAAARALLTTYTGISQAVAAETPLIPVARADRADAAALQAHADLLQAAGVLSQPVVAKNLLLPSRTTVTAPK